MATLAGALAQVLLPKKGPPSAAPVGVLPPKTLPGPPPDGLAYSTSFRPTAPIKPVPGYNDHLNRLYDQRTTNDSRVLLNLMVTHDPDVSSAINSFLGICASTTPVMVAYGPDGQIDPEGIDLVRQILGVVTEESDYTQGYSNRLTFQALLNEQRYMVLMRGSSCLELVLDKTLAPTSIRNVDAATLHWFEYSNGDLVPEQWASGGSIKIRLNVPTFFIERHHQNPVSIYDYSCFVSAINTISARQLVISELYTIMQKTGFPRVDITVVEEVLLKHAPKNEDFDTARNRVNTEIARIQSAIADMTSSQGMVHSDAVKVDVINKNSQLGVNVTEIIAVLDSQNQAALRVMPAVVGKGSNGQVASTEARLFAISCDALNRTIASQFSKLLTMATRLAGYQGKIVMSFPPVELRPAMELEPQKTMKQSRLQADLSLGIISDMEYCLEMYGRPPLPGAPPLSGTLFADPQNVTVNETSITPNSDPLGRSLVPEGSAGAKSKGVSTRPGAKPGSAKGK